MKRILICLTMALLCWTRVHALDLSAHSAILMDGTTGQVLYENNSREKSLIASTTKIMTALLTLECCSLDDAVTVAPEAVGVEGSSMYLEAGERLTVEELLHGLMLSSGNDAAAALAIHISGSIEGFAEAMNQKARALGLEETSFANPHGLDSGENYSTARDLGKLAMAAMAHEDFRKVVSTKSVSCGNRYLVNHNKLLWQYDGAVGVKTGFTKKAGRILVGAAERNGRRLISVTINAPNDWQDHKKLLDYGFSLYQEFDILEEGEIVGTIPVISGTQQQVEVLSGGSISCFCLPGEKPELRVYLPGFLYAPVAAGTEVGTGEMFLEGKSIGTVPLVLAKQVEEAPCQPGIWERILEYIGA